MNIEVKANPEPILNIFIRNDMTHFMSSGRAIAQASHATSLFHKTMEEHKKNLMTGVGERLEALVYEYDEWVSRTNQGFGTVIVKDMHVEEMFGWKQMSDDGIWPFIADVVIDPDFPISDGMMQAVLNDVPTCLYMFGAWRHPVSDTKVREVPLLGRNGDLFKHKG